ncbi:hypothetical protein AGMMS49957_18330 [Synergistales bacterium]|nr:hypothetical protein AGMMS49957_18330 [Synergistales bacterium]
MQTVTFDLEEATKSRLDALADMQNRDRSYIINEALNSYIDLQEWQLEHIQEGIRQADNGEFASDEEVEATFARWRQ